MGKALSTVHKTFPGCKFIVGCGFGECLFGGSEEKIMEIINKGMFQCDGVIIRCHFSRWL